MSKKRSKVRFQNEVDLIKVHYKKQSRGQSLTCLDMFNGRRNLRKRSVAGILCGSLLLTVISAIVLGKTTTVVYASDIEKYTNADFAMDTVVSETLYTSGKDINTQIGEKLREMETTLLSWTEENSQISQLNNAEGKTMEVSDDLAADLEKIRQLSQDSDGAFDPTLGKIIRLWNIDGENPHVPDQSEIDTLLPEVGYEKIQVDGNNVTLLDGCTLDLGAVGKGMGCDQIMDYLQTQPDVFGMILNLGGSSVMTYGEKPDGSSWKVALTDPGTFRISLASPGKTVPTGKQADSIKPALSAIMTFGTCFIMQKTKKNAGRNRQVLQPQRIFFTGKDMKEIQ